MRTIVLVITVIVVAFAASAALAQETGDRGEGRMAKIDKNGDGMISKDEWTGRPETFDKLDANSDGKLDMSEMAVAREKARGMQEGARERRGERGDAGPRGEADTGQMKDRVAGAAMFAGELFRLIDADRDGRLSDEEVDSFAAKIKEADADKDGFVTKDEAREYIRKRMAQRIGEAFLKKFDADKDGKVTKEEFKGEDKRFEWLDADKDGVITLQDFEKRGPEPLERRLEGPRDGRGRGEGQGAGEGRRGGADRGPGEGPERPRRERRGAEKESAD